MPCDVRDAFVRVSQTRVELRGLGFRVGDCKGIMKIIFCLGSIVSIGFLNPKSPSYV